MPGEQEDDGARRDRPEVQLLTGVEEIDVLRLELLGRWSRTPSCAASSGGRRASTSSAAASSGTATRRATTNARLNHGCSSRVIGPPPNSGVSQRKSHGRVDREPRQQRQDEEDRDAPVQHARVHRMPQQLVARARPSARARRTRRRALRRIVRRRYSSRHLSHWRLRLLRPFGHVVEERDRRGQQRRAAAPIGFATRFQTV